MRLSVPSLALALLAAASAAAQTPQAENLEIRTATGAVLPFRVELADEESERAVGLMHRHKLAEDAGMLFLFERDQTVSMWMKNTYIPLDMLFLSRDGEVVGIAERTVPHSLEVISSPRPVGGVLELNGGTAARLGIKPGDRAFHPALGK